MSAPRRALLGIAAAGLAAPALRAQESWPNRPIRIISSGAPGGTSDIFIRLLEPRLRTSLGQPLWIDNRPGAAGHLAAEMTARAPPDGYSFFVNHIAVSGIGPSLYQRLAYDPVADFAPVARLATLPNMLIVNRELPVGSVPELVAHIRARPGQVNCANSGSGTSSHMGAVLFARALGLDLTHVSYRATANVVTAVLGGEVQMAIENAVASAQQVRAGLLRGLAVTTAQRAGALAEVPTMQEAGVPGYELASWFGVTGPAAVPRPIVERLGAEVLAALADPATAARLREFGADPAPLGPAAYDAFIRGEIARWAPIVAASGARVE